MLLVEICGKLEVWLAIKWSWKQTNNNIVWEWLGANDSKPRI